MRRRAVITLLGGAAAWPLAGRAQQDGRVRRIGVLTQYVEGDPAGARNIAAFRQKIRQLGWVEGYNLAIEYRWAAGRLDLYRKHAAELAAGRPDLLMASTGNGLRELLEVTRTIPIVFTSVLDPVGSGLIESLAHPGGNATGFILFEWSIASKCSTCSGKWHRESLALRSFAIPQARAAAGSLERCRPRQPRWDSSCVQSTYATSPASNGP